MKDYKLANLRKKELKLSRQREEILMLEPEEILDKILSSPQPATLIQSFSDQDLYFLMHSVGRQDFIPVLALSSSDQWEYILDMDIWRDDKPDINHMTRTLNLLFQAAPERLMHWTIKEKPDLLEYYFFKNIEIRIREHDEVPPDEDDFITFDDKFYFRFPGADSDKNRESAQDLIVSMFDKVADMDISVFHAVLLETVRVLALEVEEEQLRLKNVRLAEKGFLPAYEAIGVYQPLSLKRFRKRRQDLKKPWNPDIPMAPQLPSKFIKEDNLFAKALGTLKSDLFFDLQSEFAFLVNKVISADRVRIHGREDIEKVIEKTCSYLSIGLEKTDLNNPGSVIESYFLEDIFRAGSSEILKLGRIVQTWHGTSFLNKNSLPLSFLDEKWLGITGGLLLERPLFFDGLKPGESYRNFKSLVEIKDVTIEADKLIETDRMLGRLNIDMGSFSHGILTYKSMLLTLWAREHLGMDNSLNPIPVDDFKKFFQSVFSSRKEPDIEQIKREDFLSWVSKAGRMDLKDLKKEFITVVHELFDEIEEEYGNVNPVDMDLRFIRHFLLI